MVRGARWMVTSLVGAGLLLSGCVRIDGPYRCDAADDCPGGQCIGGICVPDEEAPAIALPPEIGAVSVPEAGRGCIPLSYELAHPSSRPADVAFYFRTLEEETWRRATPAPPSATASEDVSQIRGSFRIPTRPALRESTFVWASDVDLPGFEGVVELAFEAQSDGAVAVLDETPLLAEVRNGARFGALTRWHADPVRRLLPLRLGTGRLAVAGLLEDGGLGIRQPGGAFVEVTLPGKDWAAVAAADVTGDGHDEVLLVDPDDLQVYVVRRQGSADFVFAAHTPPMFLEGDPIAATVGEGDVLGEGRRYAMAVLDAENGDAHLTLLSGDPIAGLEVQARGAVEGLGAASGVQLADLNGDGRLEAIVVGSAGFGVFGARWGVDAWELVEIATRAVTDVGEVQQIVAGEGGRFGVIEGVDPASRRLHLVRLMPGGTSLAVQTFTNLSAAPKRMTPPRRSPGGGGSFHVLLEDPASVIHVTRRDGDTQIDVVVEEAGEAVHDLVLLDLERTGRAGLLLARSTGSAEEIAFAPSLGRGACVQSLALPGASILPAVPSSLSVMVLGEEGRAELVVGFEEATPSTQHATLNVLTPQGTSADFMYRRAPAPVPYAMARTLLADLTGDGLDDLVFWNASDGVGVISAKGLAGDHEAVCAPSDPCLLGIQAREVRALDTNGNGRAELLVVDGSEVSIRRLRYDPHQRALEELGTIAEPDADPLPIAHFDAFIVEDGDDRRLALVVVRGDEGRVELWVARASGSAEISLLENFWATSGPTGVAAHADGGRIWFNVTGGEATVVTSFEVHWDAFGLEAGESDVRSGMTIRAMGFGDVDGDGRIDDVLLVEAGGGMSYVVVRPAGESAHEAERWIPVGGSVHHLAVADLTGDGRAEILVTRGPSESLPGVPPAVVVLGAEARLSGGLDGSTQAMLHGPADVAQLVPFGDEGKGAVRAHAADGGTVVASNLESEGRGHFDGVGSYREIDGVVVDLVQGDLDGDGRTDVAVLTEDPPAVHLFVRNHDSLGYLGQVPLTASGAPVSLAFGHTKRFGPALGVVSSEPGGATLSLLTGRERDDWLSGVPEEIALGSEVTKVVFAPEMMTPGRTDILVADAEGISLLAPDEEENASFAPLDGIVLEMETSAMVGVDLDNDGWMDLMAVGPSHTGQAYRSAETTAIGVAFGHRGWTENADLGPATDVVVADLVGDGLKEVVVLHGDAGVVTVLWANPENQRDFGRKTHHAVPPGASKLQVLDVDEDGRLDLVVVHPSERRMTIFWGR